MIPRLMDLPTLAAALCLTEAQVTQMVRDKEIPPARDGKWNWKSVDAALTSGKDRREHVYFLLMGDFIKIGRSVDVRRRIQSFEGFLPLSTELLFSMPGTCDTETDIHRRFKHLRTKGEWFHATGELIEFIESLKNKAEPDAR